MQEILKSGVVPTILTLAGLLYIIILVLFLLYYFVLFAIHALTSNRRK
ncbi:MAG: hypothetical protein GX424_03470 [Clostridiales bacterium]|jgi:hypothetical protein|nr:hypothetical protein [Clostridiales bacterium]